MTDLKTKFSETIKDIGNFIYSTEKNRIPVYGDIIVDGSDNCIFIDGHLCLGYYRDFKGNQTKMTTKIFGLSVYNTYKDFQPAE